MQVPTHEKLGIAFAKDNVGLCNAVNGGLNRELREDGEFAQIQARWFPPLCPGVRFPSCCMLSSSTPVRTMLPHVQEWIAHGK